MEQYLQIISLLLFLLTIACLIPITSVMLSERLKFHLAVNLLRTPYKYLKSLDYLKILFKYPRIEIYYAKNTDIAVYDIVYKHIIIGTDLNLRHAITSLLHELGHFEMIHNKNKMFFNYTKYPNKKRVGNKAVIKDEKLAWREAIRISKELNITLDKKQAIKYLKTYGGTSAHLNNLEY